RMSWKKKEKELSEQEAIDLAKKELSPFWFGTSPQIAGVKINDQYSVLPLDPEFNEKSWVVFLLDPTTFSGESALELAKVWQQRYLSNQLHTLIIMTPTYEFLTQIETIDNWLESKSLPYVICVDVE